MHFFDISDTTSIDLDKVEAYRMVKDKNGNRRLVVVISGTQYTVEEKRHKDMLVNLDLIQKGIQASSQYVRL